VRTGYGTQTEAALDTRSRPDAVQDDIGAAVRYILAQDSATATRGV
jgi:hypothetical protein